MFENLTEKLERSFKIIKGQGRITEINIAETLKEVRRALLDADVSYRVAKDFCNDVKAKALGQNVLTAVRPDQMMIKIGPERADRRPSRPDDDQDSPRRTGDPYGQYGDGHQYKR